MITDYTTYIEYFRQLAANHKAIKTFIVGPSDRYLSKERKSMDYPVLWINDPMITTQGGDSIRTTFQGEVRILTSARQNDWPDEDLRVSEMYHIAADIRNIMQHHAEQGIFHDLVGELRLEPISGITHANDVGWELSFKFSYADDICVRDCIWTTQDIIIPAFTWTALAGTLEIAIADTIDHEEYTVSIYVLSDLSMPIVEEENETTIDIAEMPATFLVVIRFDGNEDLIASALITQGQCGYSVPYRIKI